MTRMNGEETDLGCTPIALLRTMNSTNHYCTRALCPWQRRRRFEAAKLVAIHLRPVMNGERIEVGGGGAGLVSEHNNQPVGVT